METKKSQSEYFQGQYEWLVACPWDVEKYGCRLCSPDRSSWFDLTRFEDEFVEWNHHAGYLSLLSHHVMHGLERLFKAHDIDETAEMFDREFIQPSYENPTRYELAYQPVARRSFDDIVQALIRPDFSDAKKVALVRFLGVATITFNPELIDIHPWPKLAAQITFAEVFNELVRLRREYPMELQVFSVDFQPANIKFHQFSSILLFIVCAFHEELTTNPSKMGPLARFIISEMAIQPGSFRLYIKIMWNAKYFRECSKDEPCTVILTLFQALVEQNFLHSLLERDYSMMAEQTSSFAHHPYTLKNEIVMMGHEFASYFPPEALLQLAGDGTRSILFHYGGFRVIEGGVRLLLTWAPESWVYVEYPGKLFSPLVLLFVSCRARSLDPFLYEQPSFCDSNIHNLSFNHNKLGTNLQVREATLLPIERMLLDVSNPYRPTNLDQSPYSQKDHLAQHLENGLQIDQLLELSNSDLFILPD